MPRRSTVPMPGSYGGSLRVRMLIFDLSQPKSFRRSSGNHQPNETTTIRGSRSGLKASRCFTFPLGVSMSAHSPSLSPRLLRGFRMHLHNRLRLHIPKRGDLFVTGQHVNIFLGVRHEKRKLGCESGQVGHFFPVGQGTVPEIGCVLRIEFDFARRGPVIMLLIIPSRVEDPLVLHIFIGETARFQHGIEGIVVALPEMLSEPQPLGQLVEPFRIGPGLARRFDNLGVSPDLFIPTRPVTRVPRAPCPRQQAGGYRQAQP